MVCNVFLAWATHFNLSLWPLLWSTLNSDPCSRSTPIDINSTVNNISIIYLSHCYSWDVCSFSSYMLFSISGKSQTRWCAPFPFWNRKWRKKLPAPRKEIKHVPTPVSTEETMDEDAYKSASRSSFHLLATGALHMLWLYNLDIHLTYQMRLPRHGFSRIYRTVTT